MVTNSRFLLHVMPELTEMSGSNRANWVIVALCGVFVLIAVMGFVAV